MRELVAANGFELRAHESLEQRPVEDDVCLTGQVKQSGVGVLLAALVDRDGRDHAQTCGGGRAAGVQLRVGICI